METLYCTLTLNNGTVNVTQRTVNYVTLRTVNVTLRTVNYVTLRTVSGTLRTDNAILILRHIAGLVKGLVKAAASVFRTIRQDILLILVCAVVVVTGCYDVTDHYSRGRLGPRLFNTCAQNQVDDCAKHVDFGGYEEHLAPLSSTRLKMQT